MEKLKDDRLKKLFDEQLKLNKICNDEFKKIIDSNFKDRELQRKWIINYALAMQCEIAELVEGAGYKWWKKMPEWNKENIHNLKIELIDILHFLIAGMQVLGMDGDEMWDLYLKKNRLNQVRQKNGYRDGSYKKVDDSGKEDNYYLMENK